MTSLYLLAHQDDEIGVMHDIATARARGEKAVCVFLTNGAWAGVSPEIRNRESRKVLAALGVSGQCIRFLGEEAGIADGRLVEHLELALDRLIRLGEEIGDVKRVVTHAWEGGHHDHDAAHLVGRALAERLGVAAGCRQYPLYRASGNGAGVRFASPRPEDGEIERSTIPVRARWRYLALLRHYRSQLRVMVQLGPHLVRAYGFDGVQVLQLLPSAAILDRRPAEHLLYERWGLYSYERFARHAAAFVAKLNDADGFGGGTKRRVN